MNRSFTGFLAVVLAGLALGTLGNLVSPRRLAWVEDWAQRVQTQALAAGLNVVALEDVRAILQAGTTLVFDARPAADYAAGHLPGALSLPAQDFNELYPQFAPALDPASPLLVYCSSTECDESLLLGERLRAAGLTNISIFPGGYRAWVADGATGGKP